MTGSYDSVIGRKIGDVLERFLTSLPTRFQLAEENVKLAAVVLDIDESSGKAKSIERIQRKVKC